jgi:hypothetical protein
VLNTAITYDEIGELEPLHIRSNEMQAMESDWKRLVEGMWNPSRHVKRLSLLAGCVAGEAYSIYVVFDAHALTPVSTYLTEQAPHLLAVSGKYHEVFDLSGLLPVLVASLVAFALAWCVVRGTALALASSEMSNSLSGRPMQPGDSARVRKIAFNKC